MNKETAIRRLEVIDVICKERIWDYGEAEHTAMLMAVEALERQIPKKPIKVDSGCYDYPFDYECPNCRKNVDDFEHHCECGQTLNWKK